MDAYRLKDIIATNILVDFNKEDSVWVAHCLELDLVEEGENPVEAVSHLLRVMTTQIEECVKDNTPYIQPAPREYWEKLQKAKPFSLINQLQKMTPVPANVVIRQLSQHVSH